MRNVLWILSVFIIAPAIGFWAGSTWMPADPVAVVETSVHVPHAPPPRSGFKLSGEYTIIGGNVRSYYIRTDTVRIVDTVEYDWRADWDRLDKRFGIGEPFLGAVVMSLRGDTLIIVNKLRMFGNNSKNKPKIVDVLSTAEKWAELEGRSNMSKLAQESSRKTDRELYRRRMNKMLGLTCRACDKEIR